MGLWRDYVTFVHNPPNESPTGHKQSRRSDSSLVQDTVVESGAITSYSEPGTVARTLVAAGVDAR